MPKELLIQCPDGQMKTVPLIGARLSIGRSSAAELCFPEDAGLSRQHFAFENAGEDWTVQDLGSKNGTFVNNIPLKARLILKPGDRITITGPQNWNGIGDMNLSHESKIVMTDTGNVIHNSIKAEQGQQQPGQQATPPAAY